MYALKMFSWAIRGRLLPSLVRYALFTLSSHYIPMSDLVKWQLCLLRYGGIDKMLVSIAQLLVLCALVADKPITAASTHTSDSCGEVCHWSNSKYRLSFPTCAAITPNGKYWYLEHLGFGSSSSVIKAALVPSHARYSSRRPSLSTIDSHHIANDEHIVAIKIFDRRDTDTETEEFYFHEIVSEFEILQAAQHPNVVTGLELLQDGERFFAITEYCPESLMVNIQAGRVGIHESSRIFREILQTVAFLHSNGIAHRDLKIENIVICAKGVPKLIDFGSATYFALENGEMKFFRGESHNA